MPHVYFKFHNNQSNFKQRVYFAKCTSSNGENHTTFTKKHKVHYPQEIRRPKISRLKNCIKKSFTVF